MLHEYIITGFNVLVGLLNGQRLVFISIIALAVMLLWEIFSLIFSFQARFARGVKAINEYISRNGIAAGSREGLEALVAKMPTEFIRGYNAFKRNPHNVPSTYIKRSETLDLELNGGVFNQGRTILKTYANLFFVVLVVFSVAIVNNGTDVALSGHDLAEAFVLPLCFLLMAKIIYYIYAAIRQNQYKIAIDEFNEMINNFDRAMYF